MAPTEPHGYRRDHPSYSRKDVVVSDNVYVKNAVGFLKSWTQSRVKYQCGLASPLACATSF